MKMIANRTSFSVILVLLFFQNFAQAKIETVLGNLPLEQNPNIAVQAPTTSASEIILSRDQYVISYNKSHRAPNWVAWKLEQKDIGNSGRTNSFAQDTELENYLVQTNAGHGVAPSDYTNSCYDRGHQIPSADRTDNKTDNAATFLMSNMIPQTPYLNRVVWEHLETYTRELINQGKKVYVIAGPIYDADYGSIGPSTDIQVPSKDFKIIIVLDANQTTADINSTTQIIPVIMPNLQEDGSPVEVGQSCRPFKEVSGSDIHDWEQYKTTLSEVERLSGVHFSFLPH